MDASESLSNKILEEKQVEKFSQFIEKYGENVNALKKKLKDSDNGNISKVLLALAAILEEVESLTREGSSSLLYPVVVFTDMDVLEDQDDPKIAVGRLCKHFQQILNFADHCKDVLENLLSQLNILLGSGKEKSPVKLTPVKLSWVWSLVGKFLGMLAMLDTSLTHPVMQQHWLEFKRMVRAQRNEPDKFNTSLEIIRNMETVLLKLEDTVLTGNILDRVISMKLDVGKAFLDELNNFIRGICVEIEKETCGEKFLSLSCLVALHRKLSGQFDKKLVSRLWDLAKKLPASAFISLAGVVWIPEKFIQKFLLQIPESQSAQEKKVEAAQEVSRKNWLASRMTSITTDSRSLATNTASWIVKLRTRLSRDSSGDHLPDLADSTLLILSGLEMARSARNNLNFCLNACSKLDHPLTKSAISSLSDLMASLKKIQETFRSQMPKIIEICMKSAAHAQFLVLNILQQCRRSLVSDKKYSDERVDVLSCVLIAERLLAGPVTSDRVRVTRLAVSLCSGGRFGIREEDLRGMATQLDVLDTLINIKRAVTVACSTMFISPLFTPHKEISTVMLKDIYANRKAESLSHVIVALQNCANILAGAAHIKPGSQGALLESLRNAIEAMVEAEVVAPLCQEIETELRLMVHKQAGLQLDERNPFKTAPVELQPFLKAPAVTILGSRLNVKQRVEAYLEKTFYNLTTVSLHNWRTYGEMRHIARRMGLDTVEDNLPSQTVEQGLDVLEMMRNIQVFTAGYNYNMNSQVFVEQTSNSKHLNTITIRHVANSIRTHGSGIINTTVNFTYQFLRKKFAVFSQFLYDEHIKSRLSKDAKYFKENKKTLDQKYPLERAVKFNRGIRKLGLMPDGVSTYLDQFRLLVTHIGNAMGFVRMVRSGGIQRTEQAIRFVPDIEDIPVFAPLTGSENLPQEVITIAETLDATINNLTSSFESSNEYFNILVQVFSAQLSDEKQTHLGNFFMILPALTVNYIEHITTAKEKIFKKNLDGAAFTDDGFSMGLAYCLTLLDQWKQFDSLHWFESVEESFNTEKRNVDNQRATERDDKLQNTLSLKLKRVETTLREFQLLHFHVNSADNISTGVDDETKSTISGTQSNVE